MKIILLYSNRIFSLKTDTSNLSILHFNRKGTKLVGKQCTVISIELRSADIELALATERWYYTIKQIESHHNPTSSGSQCTRTGCCCGSHNSHIVKSLEKGYNLLPARQLRAQKEVYDPIIADNNLPNYLVMSVSHEWNPARHTLHYHL